MLKKRILSWVIALTFCLPAVTVQANSSAPVPQTWRNFFLQEIQAMKAGQAWRNYDKWALHDFDGDNIPEILMGKSNASNPEYAFYDVVRFENNHLSPIGTISECRYLMKDKHSHAALGLYGKVDKNSTQATSILNNFYVSNATIRKNEVLKHDANGATTEFGLTITRDDYVNKMFNYLGTYDELMVHDTFDPHVLHLGIYSWQPVVFASPYSRKLNSSVVLTKNWQLKMYDAISGFRGPENTYYPPYSEGEHKPRKYTRYGLHDFDGDSIPELLIGVNNQDVLSPATGELQYYESISYDVYKFISGDLRYSGSFDAYSKYLGNRQDGSILSYNPISNSFNSQAINMTYFMSNSLQLRTLLKIDGINGGYKQLNKDGSFSNTTQANYNNFLVNYTTTSTEIKTHDILFVPQSAVLAQWRP